MVTVKIGRHGELVPVGGFSRWMPAAIVDHASAWRSHDGLYVLSSIEETVLPGTDGVIGPQWHVSASRVLAHSSTLLPGYVTNREQLRPTDDDVVRIVRHFGLPAFDEDNHHPGVARHLWCPLDVAARTACECKTTERLIVEADGYQWTTDDTAECRGCFFQRMAGWPCTIHGGTDDRG